MAQSRKYAALPDLDSAPDTYETPELTDDNSTIPGSTVPRSFSAASTRDLDDEETSDIDRERLHPEQARTHFSPAQVDARDVDFSDRVNSKRKSYRASNRRRRAENGTEELGDFSDDEDEGLERKFARLQREVQEVKEEFEQKRASDERGVDVENGNLDADGIGTLSEVLDHIRAPRGSSASRVQTELARKLDKSSRTDSETSPAGFAPQTTNGSITSHSSSKQQDHALAKAAEFDTRLALLEKALGVNTSSTQSTTKPILPTLEQLSQQVTTLSGSSTSSLDSISRKVRQLTQEAERLESTRKAAKAAQDALKESPRSGRAVPNDGGVALEQDTTDSEQVAKINALYGTLGTIESLSPILPSVLDRLRSLRIIHADAATASENLNAVEQRQEEMAGEIKRWREGLERVESAMKEGEGMMGSNIKVVEGWVKDLEVRMKRLNQ